MTGNIDRQHYGFAAILRLRALKGDLSGGFWSITRRHYDKNYARADGQGRPLGFVLTGGEASDYNAVPDLLAIPVGEPRLFLADKGYDGDFLREELLIHGIKPVIPPRPTGRTRLSATSGHKGIETASSGCSTASNSSVALRPDTTRRGKSFSAFLGLAAAKIWLPYFVTGPSLRTIETYRG